MRRAALLLALIVAGCTPATKFADEAEELRFLQSLSNPTASQFQRREALIREAKIKEATEYAAESERRAKNYEAQQAGARK